MQAMGGGVTQAHRQPAGTDPATSEQSYEAALFADVDEDTRRMVDQWLDSIPDGIFHHRRASRETICFRSEPDTRVAATAGGIPLQSGADAVPIGTHTQQSEHLQMTIGEACRSLAPSSLEALVLAERESQDSDSGMSNHMPHETQTN